MDASFSTAKYPAYTTGQLGQFIAEGRDVTGAMAIELARRELVRAGDVAVMTAGERLRYARAGKQEA